MTQIRTMLHALLLTAAVTALLPEKAHAQPVAINSTDVAGTSLPLTISDNPSGLVFGSTTYGRQLRFGRQSNSYFYDIGLDSKNEFFITRRNSTATAIKLDYLGRLGVNTTAPTAYLHTVGTVRHENLPAGVGYILVTDLSGNVYRSSTQISAAATVEKLQEEVTALRQALSDLQAKLSLTGNVEMKVSGEKPALQVNVPNPFTTTTTIRYHYPATATRAFINVSDMNGRLVKRLDLRAVQGNAVTLDGLSITPGTYVYHLEVDGQVVDSKKMVVTR